MKPANVYLFGTCLLDLFLPQAGVDAIVLLEGLGLRVHFPQRQSCCGQPAYTSGHPAEALAVARAQLDCFAEDWPIVVPSGSCGGMIKHHWPKLFAGQPDEAQACAVAARVVEFSDFLLNHLDWRPQDLGPKVKVAVHTSCSARREMNVHLSCWALLERLANVERVTHDHESECCGFGGTFSIKHPDIAGAMVADKAAALQDSGAVEFITADGGCLLNINGKLAKEGRAFQGRHLASFLLERVGGKA
ncbi:MULTISPECIES: (Fe-S)-binding protein [Chromobacterium]|uniref:(Fe-S)-binding protein n=2 Tax=Chromobacterium TaxID=535 RepID=A0ABS3GIQ2_9NEIS|nr:MULTISPECIES: (Fe-S)-binding protein [Chromobacterium]AXT47380.1 (Fe-S)-binding protein [Chromobacterium rhizoryzae]MBK0413702.1 (Fe-S)-binding protein [Chromobacterium haemolyticum]MBO0414804.1 (Fe-S)-binding protein [Chromobacterium haemolyticum]MBO0498065.1 (Fe-S)-binding protein [Chromobacterium haemolyticum]OQS31892.1 oxidoreductase [Chromobacterium haemolyticum]